MKQQIPPAAIVAAIVAVLAIACFFGFRALGPDRSVNPEAPKGMTQEQKAQYENRSQGGGSPNQGGGQSSSNMPGYPNGNGR